MFANLTVGTQYLLQKVALLIVQIILFSAVPFAWYLITNRKITGFWEYIGIKKAPWQAYPSAFKITAIAYLFTILYFIVLKISGGMHISPLQEAFEICTPVEFALVSLVFALNAGICEEIFFRGFIAKRCITNLGFTKGNLLQAFLFTFPHLTTFGTAPTFEVIVGVINAGVLGYAFGYIMEKRAEGSLLPSMVVHTVVDLIAIPISLFLL